MRLHISSSVSGSPVNYVVPINPVFYDPKDETDVEPLEVLHGASIWQKPPNDYRVRMLRWENLDVVRTSFYNLGNYLRSVEGQIRYFRFYELDDLNTKWPNANTWKKVRIVSADFKYNPGGKLVMNLELRFKPE